MRPNRYDEISVMKFYVYKHIRLDTNRPFYIGKGSRADRASNKGQRNVYWKNIVSKHGYRIEIVRRFIDEKSALRFERYLQLKYTSKGYELANLAECGVMGSKGVKHPDSVKKVIGHHSRLLWKNEGHRKMMKARMKGLNNPESDKTIYKFYHKDFGLVECTQSELRLKYNIGHSHLSQVVSGYRIFTKGWCLYKNRNVLSHCNNTQFVFMHDFHESYRGKKMEIQALATLDPASVSRLLSGEYKHTKGWRLSKTVDCQPIDMENYK